MNVYIVKIVLIKETAPSEHSGVTVITGSSSKKGSGQNAHWKC